MTIYNVLHLRLKSMYSEVAVKVLVILVTVIVAVLVVSLYGSAKDSSRIKIGVLFEKDSLVAQRIKSHIDESEVLSAQTYDYKEGIQAVKEGEIQAFYVFNEDIEDQLRHGDFYGVVDYYLIEGNVMPYLISEILGAELVGEISITAGMVYLEEALEDHERLKEGESLDHNKMYREALDYIEFDRGETYVNMVFVDPNVENAMNIKEPALENVILYKQVILGVVYTFIAFFMMFLVVNRVRDDETGLLGKWYTSPMNKLPIYIGEYLSVLIGSLPLVLALTVVQCIYEKEVLFIVMLNLLYASAICVLLLVMASLLKKVTVFVLVSASLIIIMGIASGSFFILDTKGIIMTGLTYSIPVYQVLKEAVSEQLIDKTLPTVAYVRFMLVYHVIGSGVYMTLDRWKR